MENKQNNKNIGKNKTKQKQSFQESFDRCWTFLTDSELTTSSSLFGVARQRARSINQFRKWWRRGGRFRKRPEEKRSIYPHNRLMTSIGFSFFLFTDLKRKEKWTSHSAPSTCMMRSELKLNNNNNNNINMHNSSNLANGIGWMGLAIYWRSISIFLIFFCFF